MKMNPDAAKAIASNASSIATLACNKLLTKHSDMKDRFGYNTQELWTDHLEQRLIELSVALDAGDPSLFSERLSWSRSAMQARGLSTEDIDASLAELRSTITQELNDNHGTAALSCIDEALEVLAQTKYHAFDSQLDAGLPLDRLALQYVQTVVAGNVLPGMQLVLDAVKHGTSVADAYLRVLLPAQQEVGRLWHLNALSISEEHLVSYTTQRLMATLAMEATRKPDNGFTALAGAVAGNVHDIGIRAIAYLLELEGWRTIYLGSDIPKEEIPNTIETYEADVLLLSVALSSQLPATTETIETIRNNCDYPVKILVGGNGLYERAELWREIGADDYAADAKTA
ncbi:MAG: cobalamin-dependent protein, partial [Gammaproteobacteria bacterium]|nr:cobalamin-dependent protein [Gammaproteobacteria bacterium]